MLTTATPSFKIKRILVEIKELADKSEEEHPFVGLEKARKITRYFAERVEYQFTEPDFGEHKGASSRRDLSDKIYGGRAQLKSLSLNYDPLRIVVKGDRAHVAFKGWAIFQVGEEPEIYREEADLQLNLEEISGDWVVVKVEAALSKLK